MGNSSTILSSIMLSNNAAAEYTNVMGSSGMSSHGDGFSTVLSASLSSNHRETATVCQISNQSHNH